MKYIIIGLLFLLGGCASLFPQGMAKYAGSAVDYLYPNAGVPVKLTAEIVTNLKLPVRVGIAFAPSSAGGGNGL